MNDGEFIEAVPVRDHLGNVIWEPDPADPGFALGKPNRISRAVSAFMVTALALLVFGLILSAIATA